MPNWCETSYIIEGDHKEIYDLYHLMHKLEHRKASLLPNGFGKRWLGNLVHALGGDWKKVYCRGEWHDLQLVDKTLCYKVTAAWQEPFEVDRLLKEKYPSLRIFFMAEEELLEYYKTNDIEGKYFPTRYTLYSEDYIIECSSSEALLTAASEEYGVSFQDMPELNNYLGEHEDKGYYIEYKLLNG